MTRLLGRYLIVTGVAAAISLAAPWLVLLGLFALFLPGLILGAMPTAFLYGCVFAAVWLPLHRVLGNWRASLVAVAIGGLLLWELPAPSAATSAGRFAAAIRPDVTPVSRIRLAGHLRIDQTDAPIEAADPANPRRGNAARCDDLCTAALFTPGVQSVTLNPLTWRALSEAEASGTAPLSLEARTFRRVARAGCKDVSPPVWRESFGLDHQARQALAAWWNLRRSTTDCIEARRTRTEHELTIAQTNYFLFGDPNDRSNWSLTPAGVRVERLELRTRGGAVLLRRLIARTETLRQPLWIAFSGWSDPGWARATLSNVAKYAELKPGQQLAAYTDLAVRVAPAATGRLVRARLQAMLADRSIGAEDAGWAAAPVYLAGLRDGIEPADRALVPALIRDRRMTHFDRLGDVIAGFGDDAAILRAPMVERIASADDESLQEGPEVGALQTLGRALDNLPPGTFAAPSRAERALLADPAARWLAPGLIMRQADRGAAATPDLIAMLVSQLQTPVTPEASARTRRFNRDADRMVIDAVGVALCRLGPAGAGALPRLAAIDAAGLRRRRFDQDADWQFILARLGRPIDTLEKPANMTGGSARWRTVLRDRLARYHPSDCS